MKKLFFRGFLSVLCMSAGVLLAGQLILFNNTKKPIEYSLKFFHNKAQQKMKIGLFRLKPREKTCFPQDKDMHLASPIKLNVHQPSRTSTVMKFDQDDESVHNLTIEEHNGKIVIEEKTIV